MTIIEDYVRRECERQHDNLIIMVATTPGLPIYVSEPFDGGKTSVARRLKAYEDQRGVECAEVAFVNVGTHPGHVYWNGYAKDLR